MLNNIKNWCDEHRKVVTIIMIVTILLVSIPFIINTIQSIQPDDEGQTLEKKVNLTGDQQALINDYNNETHQVLDVLTNSKWIDHSGLRCCFITENQIIERYNNEEQIKEFAICSIEKESNTITDSKGQFDYHITLLLGNGDYSYMTFKRINEGRGESDPIFSSTISGKNCFKNATEYFRVTNSDNFNIPNWEKNADQFIGYKYDEMFSQLKDYCAKNYPQINNLEWCGEININYINNTVAASFKINKQQNYTLVCTYNNATGTFEIRRGR